MGTPRNQLPILYSASREERQLEQGARTVISLSNDVTLL